MAILKHGFHEEDFAALKALHHRITTIEKRLGDAAIRANLTDEARSYGKNLCHHLEEDRTTGVAGWVVGSRGEFFAAPFWTETDSASCALLGKLALEAQIAQASWLRVSLPVWQKVDEKILERCEFSKIFQFVELEWRADALYEPPPIPRSLRTVTADRIHFEKFREFCNRVFEHVDNFLPLSERQSRELWSGETCNHELSEIWADSSGEYVAFVVIDHDGHVDSIGVHPSARGRGLATSLYHRVMANVHSGRRIRRLSTLVSSRNAASLRLHESLQFREVGRRQVWERTIPPSAIQC